MHNDIISPPSTNNMQIDLLIIDSLQIHDLQLLIFAGPLAVCRFGNGWWKAVDRKSGSIEWQN